MTRVQSGRLQDRALREAWTNEAHDFTPWLAENMDQIAEAIGVPLELTGPKGHEHADAWPEIMDWIERASAAYHGAVTEVVGDARMPDDAPKRTRPDPVGTIRPGDTARPTLRDHRP